jgi:hypothetical protein
VCLSGVASGNRASSNTQVRAKIAHLGDVSLLLTDVDRLAVEMVNPLELGSSPFIHPKVTTSIHRAAEKDGVLGNPPSPDPITPGPCGSDPH